MREGRRTDELRPLTVELDYLEQPHGSVLWSQGKTKVLCTAMIDDEVPRWLRNKGKGWMTAEYSLLPASTGERVAREASRGKQGGRTVEIQRLIGRALRGVVDFEALGERTVWLDCDVLQADGGTRCAAISGAYVAARRALDKFGLSKALAGSVAAVSVGIVDGEPLLDLEYTEDSTAEADMNVVMTGDGRLVEVQATAEGAPFTREELDELLDLASGGIAEIARGAGGAVCLTSRRSTSPFRLFLAAVLGGAVGSSARFASARPGFARTCSSRVGSALFFLVSAYAWTDWSFSQREGLMFDPTRIAAQIVSGIGFLGAGAIIRQGRHRARAHDGGDVLARRGHRHGVGRRLLGGRGHRDDRGDRHALAAPHRCAPGADAVSADDDQRLVVDLAPAAGRRAGARRARGARRHGLAVPALGEPRRARARRDRRLRRASAGLEGRGPPRRARARVWAFAGPTEGAPRLEEREQAPRAEARAPGLGAGAARRRRLSARGRRDVLRQRARQGALRPRAHVRTGCSARTRGSRSPRSAGGPGVESARWADDGVAALLEALQGVEDRRARYVCELVALSPEGEELRGTGTVEGTIALEPRGSEGFGYDPIFVPDGESRTVAELGNDWKREHSHRARAAQALTR